MKNGFVLCLALGLSACATPSPQADPGALTELLGLRYSGKPVQAMMAHYGAPLRQMPVGEETVYSWERTNELRFKTQAPAMTRCQLDAYVRKDGVVRTIGLSGQNGACPLFE